MSTIAQQLLPACENMLHGSVLSDMNPVKPLNPALLLCITNGLRACSLVAKNTMKVATRGLYTDTNEQVRIRGVTLIAGEGDGGKCSARIDTWKTDANKRF